MNAPLTTRPIWARHTDVKGNAYVSEHIVWDAERFIAARQADASKANAEQKGDAPRLAKVEQITQPQYLAERKAS